MFAQDLLPMLRAFALRTKSATVDLRQFCASLPKGRAQPEEVEAAAGELVAKGILASDSSGMKPRVVTFPDFHDIALVEEYRQLTIEPVRPFPKEETAPVPVPSASIIPADVKSQLGALLDTSSSEMKGIVRLQFTEGVDSLVVPRQSVATDLVEAAVAKISRYLQEGKNNAYAESKLSAALRGNEVLMRQALEDVSIRPKKAATSVLSPTDFTFRFWTHLSNLILQDLKNKSEKTAQDQGVLQSAYIAGYAVFHMKGAAQREKEWATDRKHLETQVRKAPFVFGYQELYDLKDEKGVPFSKKHSRDFIHSFLTEKTKRAGEDTVPYLVRVHAAEQKKDYFIHRDLVGPVFLKKLTECSEDLRKQILDEWTEEMRKDSTPASSRSDGAFRKDVETRVKKGYPLLSALANGGLLFLVADETNVSEQTKADIKRCFAVESILRPFDELLGLSRAQLLKNARMYLPFWLTMPVLSGILRLFRRLFRGRQEPVEEREGAIVIQRPEDAAEEQPASGEDKAKKAADRENLQRYKRSVQSLMAQYVPKGGTIDGTLAELAERWNPLYDAAQKKNLVEDVNALVRDFLRPIRRSFIVRPPDMKRIHSLAEQLSLSKSLSQIKKRDVLMRYIELYMIRCLQVKQL
jgi:hypothetical protein